MVLPLLKRLGPAQSRLCGSSLCACVAYLLFLGGCGGGVGWELIAGRFLGGHCSSNLSSSSSEGIADCVLQ